MTRFARSAAAASRNFLPTIFIAQPATAEHFKPADTLSTVAILAQGTDRAEATSLAFFLKAEIFLKKKIRQTSTIRIYMWKPGGMITHNFLPKKICTFFGPKNTSTFFSKSCGFFVPKNAQLFSKIFHKKKWPPDSHTGARRPLYCQNWKNKSGNTG